MTAVSRLPCCRPRGDRYIRHFLGPMLAHHDGGVPMALFAAEQASVPAVRELAARVVIDPSKEIAGIRLMIAAAATLE